MNENQHSLMPVMWVDGEGRVKVEPDMAEVKIGVVTENEQLSLAQNENAQKISTLIQSLRATGIEKRDIQTDDYYIFPEYDYQNGKQVFRGYRVTHQLSVTINEIQKVGEVIDLAVSKGANRVSNVKFDVHNRNQYEHEALRRSVFDAQRKALLLCQTLQVRLQPVPIKVLEGSNYQQVEERPMSLGKTAVLSSSSTPVAAGQTEITANIRAQFTYSI